MTLANNTKMQNMNKAIQSNKQIEIHKAEMKTGQHAPVNKLLHE